MREAAVLARMIDCLKVEISLKIGGNMIVVYDETVQQASTDIEPMHAVPHTHISFHAKDSLGRGFDGYRVQLSLAQQIDSLTSQKSQTGAYLCAAASVIAM